jgi:shikimate dehydrogenase
MIKLGIIGYPLGHSLSPIMHKAAFDHCKISADYQILETEPEDIISQLKYLKVQGYRGFNVTIPLKVWITPLLNEVDDHANLVGAVNTVLIKDNKDLSGFNTDVFGFMHSIPAEFRSSLIQGKAAVLGAGGAARAVAVALIQLGIAEITFYARNQEKALQLRDILITNFHGIKINVQGFSEFADFSYASIIVNTTPIGMEGINQIVSPVTRSSIESINNNAIVYDLIYNPRETIFLRYAKARGLYTIGGSEMLVLQGAKAFEIWTGKEAPIDVMREAVLKSCKN